MTEHDFNEAASTPADDYDAGEVADEQRREFLSRALEVLLSDCSHELAPAGAALCVGRRVHCILYGGKDGTIYEVCPLDKWGYNNLRIVWDNGSRTQVPRSIATGVQWRIYDSIARPEAIAAALLFCEYTEAANKRAEETKKRKREQCAQLLRLERDDLIPVADGSYATAAHGAKNLRKELKAAFPGVKFSVTSKTFAGGDSIDVRWEYGPTHEEVEKYSAKYQEGRFNSSEDLYEHNPDHVFPKVFGGAKYVSVRRETPDAAHEYLIREFCRLQKIEISGDLHSLRDGNEWVSSIVHQIIGAHHFQTGEIIIGLQRRKDTSGCRMYEHFELITM